MNDEWCYFDDVEVVAETPKALLCDIDGEKVWIPKSQMGDESEVWMEGDSGLLVISDWIAGEKGLLK